MWYQLVDVNQVPHANKVHEMQRKWWYLWWSDKPLALCCRDVRLHGQSGSFEVSGAQHASSKPWHTAVHVSPSQTVRGREWNHIQDLSAHVFVFISACFHLSVLKWAHFIMQNIPSGCFGTKEWTRRPRWKIESPPHNFSFLNLTTRGGRFLVILSHFQSGILWPRLSECASAVPGSHCC